MELDGIVGAHLVAAVAADAVFCIDLSGRFVFDSDHMHGAGISAGATGYALGFDRPGKDRESIPEDRI